MRLLTDYLSIPARELVPLLEELEAKDAKVEQARKRLLNWDYRLTKTSVAAGIYVAWERALEDNVDEALLPEATREHLGGFSMTGMIHRLVVPDSKLGPSPVQARDELLLRSLAEAVSSLDRRLGADMSTWQYGQEAYKHALLRHPLSPAVDAETREKLEVGPVPRGGNSYTLNSTGGSDNQRFGASFRIIANTADWDRSVGMSAPGQSGNPESPFYDNLFELWAKDQYFPVYYSRDNIDRVAREVIVLSPQETSHERE